MLINWKTELFFLYRLDCELVGFMRVFDVEVWFSVCACQTHYFGLWFHTKSQSQRWVDLEKALKKQLDKFGSEPMLFFGVMFYIPSVSRLQQEVTRWIICLHTHAASLQSFLHVQSVSRLSTPQQWFRSFFCVAWMAWIVSLEDGATWWLAESLQLSSLDSHFRFFAYAIKAYI